MDRHTPPSPAPIKTEPLPSGFHELLQQNASMPYFRGTMHADSIQARSQPTSRYGTPGPRPQPHQPQGQVIYPQDDSPYGPIPEPYGTPATSSPTPSRGSDVVGNRSNARGDVSARVLGPRSTRVEKSTPKRKKERARPLKNMPVLDKPMSELTKGSSIPIADIEAYVHRSVEVRQQEIETGKNPGRVKRPMNAFMLYRKAYQQRAKEWASQHNHQIVSRVCGLSWPLEPEHIRQQFKSWADTERDNHQKAHPNYKFTPAKPHKPPPKFEGPYDEPSDGSDLEDYDWAGGADPRMRSATHTPGADSDYVPGRSVYATTHAQPNQFAGMQAPGMLHHTRSAGLGFDPGRSLPGTYDHLQAQYYEACMRNQQHQQHLHQHRHLQPGVGEDGLVHRTPSPSLTLQEQTVGLHPHYDLGQYQPKIGPQSTQDQSQPHQHQLENRIDPSLMPQDDSMFDTGNGLNMFDGGLGANQQTWLATQLASVTEAESQFVNAFMGLEEPLSLEQQTQFLKGEWQVETLPETAHLDAGWVEQKN
ncbi:hypothetical protein C7999DRAFT_42869 [Corynascus novoguineensis]|uniref:HMG box domain-containing protein n=1 Tax=Corynascus novoguineensis TaxID=1126955 RepID=A0AAN7CP25_9PEZI|nr:hypothetical protein C7999DRAFT_42869 [Corynascus novoguineensis]